jgi:hypothetical protein
VNVTGWLTGLRVTGDGTGIVSHAGVALLRVLADKTGLTAGLSRALASRRLLVHDRGRVLADLACAIADGAEVISDFRVMTDQGGADSGSRRNTALRAACSLVVECRPLGRRRSLVRAGLPTPQRRCASLRDRPLAGR